MLTVDMGKVDVLLEKLQGITRRGRSAALDQRMARWGFLPAQSAAVLLGQRVGTLYKAHKRGRIELLHVEGYWFVARAELLRYAAAPVRRGRPPKSGGSHAD